MRLSSSVFTSALEFGGAGRRTGALHADNEANLGMTGLIVVCGCLAASTPCRRRSYPSATASPAVSVESFDRAAIIPIRGEINEITLDSMQRRLDRVQAESIRLVIFEMDTPGGALDATLKICQAIKITCATAACASTHGSSRGVQRGHDHRPGEDGIVMASNATHRRLPAHHAFGRRSRRRFPRSWRPKPSARSVAELRDSARRNGYDMNLVMG